ncbi:hypothetical protein FLWE109334_11765 [Flavobacterium weaverense]|uniref:Uncharacterized protein n=2 Tax=Flavobacterium weaverense TaxID=271156 RepID=A0A3L9ZK03_9FLAO|nr:hypothetical protein BC961_2963 [Flavobacterium weaverense]
MFNPYNILIANVTTILQKNGKTEILKMTSEQLIIFRKAFKIATSGFINLPKVVSLEKITEIEFYSEGMRGGHKVRFFVKKNELEEFYIDLFGSDDYSSFHKRIEKDGNIIELNNYKGQFGRTIYPDDPEKTESEHLEIQKHNSELHKELIEKGLERDFENPAFERNNVIKN